MTNVQDKPGRGDNRALMWLGHYSIYLMVAALAAQVGAIASGGLILPGVISALLWLTWLASIAADGGYHQSRLCERCIAATPLDPQVAVNRWRPALRWAHRPGRKFLVLLGAVIAMNWIVYLHLAWWVWILIALAVAGYASFFVSEYQHRKLYPWCPYCRWDDGGDEEVSPDVPAPTVSK
jgi:hypothetical protein